MKGLEDEYGWKMHAHKMYKALGLNPKQHLPEEGLPSQRINGVVVYVLSKTEARERKVFHRVRCYCPGCLEEMSAGRLHQHKCKPENLVTFAEEEHHEPSSPRHN